MSGRYGYGYDGGSGSGGHHRGRDRERERYPSGGRDDRSRSRDYDRGGNGGGYGGSYGGRGGGGGGGYGGGGGGGFGGRGGGRGGRGGRGGGRGPVHRPDNLLVKTNYFKLEIMPNQGSSSSATGPRWEQYRVEIFNAVRAKDDQNKFVYHEDGKPKIVRREKNAIFKVEKGATPLSTRILNGVSKILRESDDIHLVHDGASAAYSSKAIAMDVGTSRRKFAICTKKECDDDDPDKDLLKNAWFEVCLEKVANVYPMEGTDEARHAMDIIFRSAMIYVGMPFFGKSPRLFYFPQSDQEGLARGSRELENMHRNKRDFMPMIGLMQAVRFCESGNDFSYYLNCDTAIDFANRQYEIGSKKPIRILDPNRGTICGIRVDLGRAIRDERTKDEIRSALKKLTFNVEYESKCPKRIEMLKSKGLSERDIQRRCTNVRKNKFMREEVGEGGSSKGSIIWSADDPDLHSFEFTDRSKPDTPGRMITVAEYFRIRYNIHLRFPKMPLVFLGNKEWFPIEFLYQAFSKTKAPGDDTKRAVLQYYNDVNAGTHCVQNIGNLANTAYRRLQKLGFTVEQVLQQFNLRLSNEPVEVTARVLRQPKIKFDNNLEKRINNGSWDLRDVRFHKPAAINSFALVDLTGQRSGEQFVTKFLQVASRHGMVVPPMFLDRSGPRLSDLIVSQRCNSTDDVGGAIDRAIGNAKKFFLHDSSRWFRQNGVWFKSGIRNEHGTLCRCLVLPHDGANDQMAILLEAGERMETHEVTYQGATRNARLVKKVNCFPDPVDPFHFRYNGERRCYEAYDVNRKEWVQADRGEDYFNIEGVGFVPAQNVSGAQPVTIVDPRQIECPSILFVMLEDPSIDKNNTEKYNFAKLKCQFEHGIPSQSIVTKKYEGQRSKDQYCSNVAIKVNAKLSNALNCAEAWTIYNCPSGLDELEGITWCGEVPTMILGISMANSVGSSDSYSVISVSATMDQKCMRFAQAVSACTRTEIIDDTILSDLTKSMMLNFARNNGYDDDGNIVFPKRVLVYRDGVSEGLFTRLQACEIQSIRRGYLKARESVGMSSGKECDFHCGCTITFVACMTHNNCKIVPSNHSEGIRSKRNVSNVHSGTCVDTKIIDGFSNLQVTPKLTEEQKHKSQKNGFTCYTEPDGGGYDFLLVAHGAGLGTSKPVQYRIILNENAVLGEGNATPLTKEKLEQLTYELSFQYSTASKTVRCVPAIYYADRLANMALSYLRYLFYGNKVTRKELDEVVESERRFLRTNRDGHPEARYIYLRSDLEDEEGKGPVNPNLLPAFTSSVDSSPFSSHISA